MSAAVSIQRGSQQISRFGDQFCNVFDVNVPFFFCVFDAVGHHGVAEWATCGHNFGAGLKNVVCAFVVDFTFAFLSVLEHLSSTSAAAQAIFLAPSHLNQVSIQCLKGRTRGIVFAISAAQVAGVVKRGGLHILRQAQGIRF